MDSIIEILKFCYDRDCIPETIVFDGGRSFDNFEDLIGSWNDNPTSLVDAELHEDSGLMPLKTVLVEEDGYSYAEVVISEYEEKRQLFRNIYEMISEEPTTLPELSIISYNAEYSISKVDSRSIFGKFLFPMMLYKNMRKLSSSHKGSIPKWILPSNVYTKVDSTVVSIGKRTISFKSAGGISSDDLSE